MQDESFKPREMDNYEERTASLLTVIEWNCEEGRALANFTFAAISASTAMKKRFGFESAEEFRTWCKQLPGGEALDYPFPSAQTNNAFIACIEHVKTCEVCGTGST